MMAACDLDKFLDENIKHSFFGGKPCVINHVILFFSLFFNFFHFLDFFFLLFFLFHLFEAKATFKYGMKLKKKREKMRLAPSMMRSQGSLTCFGIW